MADDLHTLSAPYALDALTPDEREQFEEHLRTCDRCQAELAGLQDTAASLAFAVEGRLRRRRSERRSSTPPAPTARTSSRSARGARSHPSRRRSRSPQRWRPSASASGQHRCAPHSRARAPPFACSAIRRRAVFRSAGRAVSSSSHRREKRCSQVVFRSSRAGRHTWRGSQTPTRSAQDSSTAERSRCRVM